MLTSVDHSAVHYSVGTLEPFSGPKHNLLAATSTDYDRLQLLSGDQLE
jgi:hypothetical protein